jgi:hypothetical protein
MPKAARGQPEVNPCRKSRIMFSENKKKAYLKKRRIKNRFIAGIITL